MSTEKNETPTTDRDSDTIIQGHQYDGIQEYDNPMPGWWSALFIITVVFSFFYLIAISAGWINDYEDDLDDSLAELQAIRTNFEQSNPTVSIDSTYLASIVNDPARIAAGKEVFSGQCAVCHAADGGGVIGPNLTDEYWLHGGSNMDIWEVIRVGVPEKGMAPWESVFTVEERASLVAYIRSLVGTTPANAKEPQGERYTNAS